MSEHETQDVIAARARLAVAAAHLPDEHELEAAGMTPDMVNAPPHYATLPCGVEPIDVVEELPYNRGAAVKYLLRTGKKGDVAQAIEDLEKAAWYCTREAARIRRVLAEETR